MTDDAAHNATGQSPKDEPGEYVLHHVLWLYPLTLALTWGAYWLLIRNTGLSAFIIGCQPR